MPLPPPIIDASMLEELDKKTEAALRDSILAKKTTLIAKIKRTGCYGKCPEYEAQVFSNDSVYYIGFEHVAREGRFSSFASKDWIVSILQMASEIDYNNLNDVYPETGKPIKGLPTTFTMINLAGTEKTVENNYDAPQELMEFEHFFELQLEKLSWSKLRH